uniref:Uncharacterized protein n=1 Tax=Caenorhabditis japonica TaxID=281687 RepID=A0A8R1DVZ9_CAEJA
MIKHRLNKSNSDRDVANELIQDSIEFNIKFGYDRKKRRKDKSDSTESSSESPVGLEKFENEEDVAISPGENPTLDPSKIESEELDQEIGSRNVSRPSTYRQLFLLLSCVTLLKNNLVFIECFFNHGGIYFLVPYFTTLFVLGVPMAIFELSLAQYSSIPMYGMFVRMAPLLGGVPYLVLILRIGYTVFVALEPRFLLYMYKALSTVITENKDWAHCYSYNGVRCYDPTLSCGINEFQLNGKCITDKHVTEMARFQDYGLLGYYSFREQRLASLIPAQIYKEVKSLEVMDNMFAALVLLLIAGFITYKGHRFFVSVAGFFFFVPIIGVIPVVLVVYYDVSSRKKHFFYEMVKNNDISKIFHLQAWLNAARVSVKTVYIADGTLMALGSLADFRHNFIKDAILLAASGAAYRLLLCFGILPLLYVGNDILFPFSKTIYTSGELVQFHAIELFFSALPSYSIPEISSTSLFFIYVLLYGTINFAFIAYQVITLDMLIHWIHHMFPRLLYQKHKGVKICIIMSMVTFILLLYAINLPNKIKAVGYQMDLEVDDYYVGLVSTTVFVQLVSVAVIYGYKRLLINYMLSITSVIMKKYQTYRTPLFIYAFISAMPLLFFVRKLTLCIINKEFVSSLSQTHCWQPANEGHARESEHDERAAGVLR